MYSHTDNWRRVSPLLNLSFLLSSVVLFALFIVLGYVSYTHVFCILGTTQLFTLTSSESLDLELFALMCSASWVLPSCLCSHVLHPRLVCVSVCVLTSSFSKTLTFSRTVNPILVNSSPFQYIHKVCSTCNHLSELYLFKAIF